MTAGLAAVCEHGDPLGVCDECDPITGRYLGAETTETMGATVGADVEHGNHGVDGADGRRLTLTPASAIRTRRVVFTWQDYLPQGTLVLIAGREGLGKSLLWTWLAAQLTHGTLPGVHHGTPASVLVIATEDSWSHTIAPRLIAAGADLGRVFHVRAEVDGRTGALVLPLDTDRLGQAAADVSAALIVADPLASSIDSKLDSYRDTEVRQALEPLATLADTHRCLVVGLVHHGKGSTSDPVNAVLGSRAFTATSRAVLAVVKDGTADDGSCLVALVKANLGRMDLPALRYRIVSESITTDDGPAEVGRLTWSGTVGTVGRDEIVTAMRDNSDDGGEEATASVSFLRDYLTDHGGEATAADVRKASESAGLAWRTVQRARTKAGVEYTRTGFGPGAVYLWRLNPERMRAMRAVIAIPDVRANGGTHDDTDREDDTQ